MLPQRGDGLGARIAAAHADTAALLPGRPTLQLGMDTPQADPGLLGRCLARLAAPGGAGRGARARPPTAAGGPLGLRDPRAAALVADVPTSRADTGERTLARCGPPGCACGCSPS